MTISKKADSLAERIKSEFPENANDSQRIKILVRQLFNEMGFHGSTLDFHHRSNSYMNEVIDDRKVSLSPFPSYLWNLQNGWSLKLLDLVSFRHFLTIYKSTDMSEDESNSLESKISETEIIIDSFGGKIIDVEQAAQLTPLALEDLSFEPSSKKKL